MTSTCRSSWLVSVRQWFLGLGIVSIVRRRMYSAAGANEMAHRMYHGMNKHLDKHQIILARVSMNVGCSNRADRPMDYYEGNIRMYILHRVT